MTKENINMENKEFYKKRVKIMFLISPFIFGLSIWGSMQFLQWMGMDISNKAKYIGALFALISCYAAMLIGIKKYFSEKIK